MGSFALDGQRMYDQVHEMGLIMHRIALISLVVACGPKPTDTSEMTDVNPCQEGEILQADGSCLPAGAPIEQPAAPEDDTGSGTGSDTGSGDTGGTDTAA